MFYHLKRATMVVATLAVGLTLCNSAPAGKGGKKKPPPPPPAPAYTIELLPLVDGVKWHALGMNNHGDVVGFDGHNVAVVYLDTLGQPFILSDLGDLPAEVFWVYSADGINDGRQITGSLKALDDDGQEVHHAYRCSVVVGENGPVSDFEVLEGPADYPWTYGSAINNNGDVAAVADYDGSYISICGYLWTEEDGWIQMPGTRHAWDVNDSRQVTGNMIVDGQYHAYRYTPGTGVEDLGTLARNSFSIGSAINVFGQVVGEAGSKRSGERAFRYTDGPGMEDLGVLPRFTFSDACAINSLGDVVGRSGDISSSPGVYRPLLYTDVHGMLDLTELIVNLPEGLDLDSLIVEAINDSGQICGNATVDGRPRVIMLTPID